MLDSLSQLTGTAAVFCELPESLLVTLAADGQIKNLPRNEVLFQQGDAADSLYFILTGRVGLTAQFEDNEQTVIEFFNAGDLFLIPAAILDLPCLMSAYVIDETRLLTISTDRFRHLLEAEPALALAVNRMLARHCRMLIRQIRDLKLRNTTQRLASYLLGFVERDRDSATLMLPGERRMVAARLGMTPESLSRAFQRLREFGVSSNQRLEVEIHDISALREFCRYDGLS